MDRPAEERAKGSTAITKRCTKGTHSGDEEHVFLSYWERRRHPEAVGGGQRRTHPGEREEWLGVQ